MQAARVIIVEEHTLLRDLLRFALPANDASSIVALADSVESGLTACLQHHPDLLVIGWHLPDGTALDLIRKLDGHLGSTRTLLLTTSERHNIVRTAAENGVHGLVSSRQPLAVFREAVGTLLSGKCYYCPASSSLLLEAMKINPTYDASKLTPREWVILKHLAEGHSTKDTAKRLHLSPKTVSNHLTSLKDKLNISETAGLIRFAVDHGLIEFK